MALCEWCRARRVERRGARYCSHSCRQRAYEWRAGIQAILGDLEEAQASVGKFLGILRRGLEDRHVVSRRIPKEGR
jgi:hypothetical protein